MFVVTGGRGPDDLRPLYEQHGELAAAVELRRLNRRRSASPAVGRRAAASVAEIGGGGR